MTTRRKEFEERNPLLFDRLTTLFAGSNMVITVNNTDLKQISKLLDDKLDNKLDEKLAPIKETLSGHGKILESHDKRFDSIDRSLESHSKLLESHGTTLKSIGETLKSQGKILESHGKILRSLKKDQNTMLGMLDGEQMKQRKRITKIEEHLGLTSAS